MFHDEVDQGPPWVIGAKAPPDKISELIYANEFDKGSLNTTSLKVIAKLMCHDINAWLKACGKKTIDSSNLFRLAFIKKVICRSRPNSLANVEH